MAGFIPDPIIEQIRAASDIVDVVGGYVPLKRAGANFSALCPFHREKTPSFSVSPQKQIFYCFGCHKGGDVFRFVQEFENITFPEAIQRLAERAHIPLVFENQPGEQKTRHVKDTLLKMHEQIAQRWQTALAGDPGAQIARDYLARRGVTEEAIQLFRLGYAPELWDDTVNWARSKGFEPGEVELGGLILRKEGTDHFYDRFRGRLIFPICDEQGRVIGFSGRILTDEKTAKYVNSPETPIFTKGKVFYGLDKSKRAILEAGFAVVCEGQLDLIACYMGGVKNMVAPQGTAFTGEHARILKRYVEEVVLCFDSDAAGQNAAVRVLDSLLASGLAIRVATVPAPHDPDSFIKEFGGEAFQKLIGKAEDFFDFYLTRLCTENNVTTDRGRLVVLREFGQAINKTGNAVLVDKYAQKTALRLGVRTDAVRAEFRKSPAQRDQAPPEPELEEGTPEEIPRPSEQEFWLLKLLFTNDQLAEFVRAHIDIDWIQNPLVRRLVSARIAEGMIHPWPGVATFLGSLPDEGSRALICEAIADERVIPNQEVQMADLLKQLRDQAMDRQLAKIIRHASLPETTDADRLTLMQQGGQLRMAKKQPLARRVED